MNIRGIALAVALATVVVPTPAMATAGALVLVVQGSGTISPGVSLVPGAQDISFTGTGTSVGNFPLVQTYDCSFTATVAITGVGHLDGSCGPALFTGCAVTMEPGGLLVFGCATSGRADVAEGFLVVRPLDLNPTTSFSAIGVFEYASAT